jgi:hypothetical protein
MKLQRFVLVLMGMVFLFAGRLSAQDVKTTTITTQTSRGTKPTAGNTFRPKTLCMLIESRAR